MQENAGTPPRKISRRQFLAGVAVAGVSLVAYTRWGEPHWLEVAVTRVPVARTVPGRPVRILHLSDFHASRVVSMDFIAHSIELGLAENPDVAALTGDFVTSRYDAFPAYAKVLQRLSAAVPTFACVGNHDGGPWVARIGGYENLDTIRSLLRDSNITCLHNEAQSIELAGQPIQLCGVGDLWSHSCRPDDAFANVPTRAGALRVVLCHNPDSKELLHRHDWDLMLCGHTHGGQLRLPIIGAPFAPVVDHRYVEGLRPWENRWIHVTRGVGNLHGVRFNCRPQVSLLDIG
jgi:predicted MPP superfamily phosphohydrolase